MEAISSIYNPKRYHAIMVRDSKHTKLLKSIESEVLAAIPMNNTIFWEVPPRCW
jgi:hypothetical protein